MSSSRTPDRAAREERLIAVAARQHAVITRAQLLEIGLSARAVARRLAAKRLRELHRGVYLTGPVLTVHGRVMAAVLACGGGAVASHCSAAILWRLVRELTGWDVMDVTVRHGNRRRPGIRTHRVQALSGEEVTSLEHIPVTSPARTLLDIAAVVAGRELERAVARALAQELTTSAELAKLADRYARRPGAARLRALLGGPRAPRTRSAAETRFLALVKRAGISAPQVNVEVAGHEVDCYWPKERLVVEVDGFAYHSSAQRFERDRRRDAELLAAGMSVLRVTWQQLTKEPEAVIARLVRAMLRPLS